MILIRTPLRVSFFGGGTDYPEHYLTSGGQTLSAAINKYTYLMVNKLDDLFDHRIRISWSRTELVNTIEEIQHPAARECLRLLKIDHGVWINYVGDLPAQTGLGSSSSFTVGLLHALHATKGELVSAEQLAKEAVHVEREMIKERVGVQDQFTCAYGGVLHLRFDRAGTISMSRLDVGAERLQMLEQHLMLFYTGLSRHAHEVVEEQLNRTRDGAIASELAAIDALVTQGIQSLTGDRPLARFGELLHEGWSIKRKLSPRISNAQIDECYAAARSAGAIGGKLLGAGGGGFVLLFADPERHAAIEAALSPLRRVSFSFDQRGSSVVFSRPDEP